MRCRVSAPAERGGRCRTRPTPRRFCISPAAAGPAGAGRSSARFYAEGTLIWLEADVTIRRLTNGRKSLDDFCALFHGQKDNGRVWVKPYEPTMSIRRSNGSRPTTGKTFFEKRLTSKSAELPLGGVDGGGYALVYTDAPNMFTDPWALTAA